MRSAETSGVSVPHKGVDTGRAESRPAMDTSKASGRTRRAVRPTPITTAVALTALCAATLFVSYDAVRTFDEAKHDLALIGMAFATDVADLGPAAMVRAVDALPARFNTVTRASLVAGTAPDMPMVPSHTVAMGTQGTLALETAPQGLWATIAQRAGIALALVGLLTALAWYRTRRELPTHQQRRNYQTLAAAIPMGVACWTKDGALVVCNEQYRARLNLRGNTVTYHEAVKRMIEGGYMKLLNEDENNRLVELHRQDGSCLLIDERPLADGGFMTLVSDVTERKKTDTMLHSIREEQRQLARRYHEEKLKAEAASRSKTNFLAHLSHDIRTPLNHIIGFADLMRHQAYGPLGDARYADYVQSIKSSGEHLLASFATILDLAEFERGHKALQHDPVAVDDLLERVMARFAGAAARGRLQLMVTQTCNATIEGDQLGLERMIANIVENSLRFTPAGGRICLAAFAARDGVVIEITDTGRGMDEERLASLSQPFALGDATFTREGIGPGLGISISRAIAELSGGHLAIDSSPALGTTVAISLPLPVAELSVAA